MEQAGALKTALMVSKLERTAEKGTKEGGSSEGKGAPPPHSPILGPLQDSAKMVPPLRPPLGPPGDADKAVMRRMLGKLEDKKEGAGGPDAIDDDEL